ncbi:transketolase family protein [Erysipelotrichaceae bacterium OH741_COT-311]|nr:transketolase family protein [Erysipelotrichaceae bacterium OH741_COT-311]
MGQATREAYGDILGQLILENEKIVVLDADLTKSTKTSVAQSKVPNRHFNMGIAEANMMGVAAGFASSGYTVFASTFAMFATGRAWEQVRNSIGYPRLNVKICGTHAGIAVGEDGVSHQAIEDIALMRAIPGMQVYQPCDATETKAIIRHVSQIDGPCYVRLGRSKVDDVFNEDTKFEIGKIHQITKGSNVCIFTTGLMTQAALKAQKKLQEEGIEMSVVNVSCLKPLDEEGVFKMLKEHDVIITAEEHNVIGGLGAAIAEVSTSKCPKLIHRMGIYDCFAESGPFEKLLVKYHLDSEDIVKKVKEVL